MKSLACLLLAGLTTLSGCLSLEMGQHLEDRSAYRDRAYERAQRQQESRPEPPADQPDPQTGP